MVGLFINTLPVRVRVANDERVPAWLQRLQAQQAQSRNYEHSSLTDIQSWSDVPRRDALFESIIAFENYPTSTFLSNKRGSVRVRDLHSHFELANYPLNVSISPGRSLIFRVNYDRHRFGAAAIGDLLAQLRQILTEMAAKPDGRVGELNLIGAEERDRLVSVWNETAAPYPREKLVHELFEAQAEKHPERLAVATSLAQLSYRELNERANQLAHYLKRYGVGSEVLVCVCMQRSVEMVVALLAILKAGAAYVPLDPAYPAERLAFMLADASAPVLLTQRELLPKLPATTAVICQDREEKQVAAQSRENPARTTEAHNLAYVIYTSGSTGTPKGVAIEHRGLLNLVYWHQRTYEVTERDRATQLAAQAFDASVWELWPYLTAGASIHIPDEEVRSSPPALMQWLAQERITLTFLVTPLAEAVLEMELPKDLCLKA